MDLKYNNYKAKYEIKMCRPDQLHDFASKPNEEILEILLSEKPRVVFKCLCVLAKRDLNESVIDILREVNDNGETFKNRRLANNIICQLFPEHSKNLFPGDSKQIGYVYFIQNKFSGFIKIGRTKNIERRIAIFTKMFSFPIQVIQHIRTLNYERIEKSFHNYYSKKRVRGEWFNLNDTDIAQIVQKIFPKEIEALIVSDGYSQAG